MKKQTIYVAHIFSLLTIYLKLSERQWIRLKVFESKYLPWKISKYSAGLTFSLMSKLHCIVDNIRCV